MASGNLIEKRPEQDPHISRRTFWNLLAVLPVAAATAACAYQPDERNNKIKVFQGSQGAFNRSLLDTFWADTLLPLKNRTASGFVVDSNFPLTRPIYEALPGGTTAEGPYKHLSFLSQVTSFGQPYTYEVIPNKKDPVNFNPVPRTDITIRTPEGLEKTTGRLTVFKLEGDQPPVARPEYYFLTARTKTETTATGVNLTNAQTKLLNAATGQVLQENGNQLTNPLDQEFEVKDKLLALLLLTW